MALVDIFYKPKYKIIFLRREYEAMYVVQIKIFRTMKNLVKANKKQFLLDVNTPAYIYRNQYTYLVDIDSGSQLNYSEAKRQMSPEELDTIVGTKIIRELTAGVMDNNKEKVFWTILGVVIGLLLGLAIMQYVMSEKIAELVDKYTTTSTITELPTIGSGLKLLGGWIKCLL